MAFIAKDVAPGHKCKGCGEEFKNGDELNTSEVGNVEVWHTKCLEKPRV